jgi:hypothetical protein
MSDDDEPLPRRAQFPRRVRSPITLQVYQQGMESYEGYCEARGYQAHPADVRVVCRWLDHLYTQPGKYGRPLSPDTVKVYLAAVKLFERQQRDDDPAWPLLDGELLREALAQYRWRYAQDGHAPPVVERFTAGHLLAVLARPERNTLHGRRDTAIVAMLYGATASRREVQGARVEDVQLLDGGARVWFGATGRAAFIEPNPADDWLCPVRALSDYLADLRAHGVAQGPLWGHMLSLDTWPDEWKPLSGMGISHAVRYACAKAGLGHHTAETVRAGSAKDVAEASEGDLLAVADAGGWRDTENARRHVEQRRVHPTLLGAVLGRAVPVEGQASAEE